MRRRAFLAIAASGVVAGCQAETDEDVDPTYTPDADPFVRPRGRDTPTRTPTPTATPTPLEVFRAGVFGARLLVTRIYRIDDSIQLEYRTTVTSRDELRAEMLAVGIAFADAIEAGLSAAACNAIASAPESIGLGAYHIEASWARDYLESDGGKERYVDRIFATFENIGLLPPRPPADGR